MNFCSLFLPCGLHISIWKTLFICRIVILSMITSRYSLHSAIFNKHFEVVICYSFKLLIKISFFLRSSLVIYPNCTLWMCLLIFFLSRKNLDVLNPNCQHTCLDYGLLEEIFLFACFNQFYKMDLDIFVTSYFYFSRHGLSYFLSFFYEK